MNVTMAANEALQSRFPSHIEITCLKISFQDFLILLFCHILLNMAFLGLIVFEYGDQESRLQHRYIGQQSNILSADTATCLRLDLS